MADPADYPTAEQWLAARSPPRSELIYRAGQAEQIVSMLAVAGRVGVPVRFPSCHVSKSVELPVAAYLVAPGVVVFVRDNFYGLTVAVQSNRPLALAEAQLGELSPYAETEGIWYSLAYEDTEAGAERRKQLTAECEERFQFTPTFDEIGKYPLVGYDGEPGYAPDKTVWVVGVRSFQRAQELLVAIKHAAGKAIER